MSTLQQAFLATMIALVLVTGTARAQAPTVNELAISFVENTIAPNVERILVASNGYTEILANEIFEVPITYQVNAEGHLRQARQRFALNKTGNGMRYLGAVYNNYTAPAASDAAQVLAALTSAAANYPNCAEWRPVPERSFIIEGVTVPVFEFVDANGTALTHWTGVVFEGALITRFLAVK
jgi:hypothetical protein